MKSKPIDYSSSLNIQLLILTLPFTLQVSGSDYTGWINSFNLSEPEVKVSADLEPDAPDILPRLSINHESGSNVTTYSYRRRTDFISQGLNYVVEVSNNPLSDKWKTLYNREIAINNIDDSLQQITTNISLGESSSQFFRLRVDQGTPLGPNLQSNGDFSNGMANWSSWTHVNNGFAADYNVVNGEIVADNFVLPTSVGSFARIFSTAPITLEQGKYYTISFQARSTAQRDISFGMKHTGSLGYGEYDIVDETINNTMQTYSYVYAHFGPTDPTAQLNFYFAESAEPVTLDNIEVREGGILYPDLPEILVTEDGQEVSDIATWENIRRDEILEWFTVNVYGRGPEASDYTSSATLQGTTSIWNGNGVRKIIETSVTGPNGTHTYNSYIYLPTNVTGPVPVIILINHRGDLRGTTYTSGFFPLDDIILPRGYGAAVINVDDVAPDVRASREWSTKLISKFNLNGIGDWKCLTAWAFSAERLIDYLVTDTDVDASKIGVIGHSRGGKAALWTAARDQRVALALVNDSGMMGDSLFKHVGYRAAVIEYSYRTQAHWFAGNLEQYQFRDKQMPYDLHQLLSLVAPRLLATGSAENDKLADPVGQWFSIAFAQPAFELYGVLDTIWKPTDGPYERNIHTVMNNGNLHHHRRAGNHDLNKVDWNLYLNFADSHWK